MKITAEQYARALHDAITGVKPADQNRVLENFTSLLAENGHLHLLQQIEKAFERYDQEQKGNLPVTVAMARETGTEKEVLATLNQIVGKNAVITKKVDESIMAGVLIETEDVRIDASMKNQLKKLRDQLISS